MSDLSTQLAPLKAMQPPGRLEAFLDLARAFSEEEFRFAIPSTALGPDAPFLQTVVLVSDRYIVELHLNAPQTLVDFVLRGSVRNYRVTLGEAKLTVNEKEVVYQTAVIELLHTATDNFRTFISYVGNERDHWLAMVRQALPVRTALSSRP